jgi:hypothetical protein
MTLATCDDRLLAQHHGRCRHCRRGRFLQAFGALEDSGCRHGAAPPLQILLPDVLDAILDWPGQRSGAQLGDN